MLFTAAYRGLVIRRADQAGAPGIRDFEIGDGITARRDLIFRPLPQQTTAQLRVLTELEPLALAVASERRT